VELQAICLNKYNELCLHRPFSSYQKLDQHRC